MYDPAPKRGPATPGEWLISIVLVAIILGLFIAAICYDYSPVKLSALLIVLFWVPLMVLHEAGHAVTAWLLGWYVGQVVIGMGNPLRRLRIGTAAVEIRQIPIEGFVRCVPRNLHLPGLKNALIYFAGPGADLLVAAGILVFVGPDRLFSQSEVYWLIVWQSLAVAAASQGVLNLIPHAVQTPGGEIANDGLGIIRSFLWPEAYYAALIGQTYNEEQQDWESYDPADWWKRDR